MNCLTVFGLLVGIFCCAHAVNKIVGGNRAGKDKYPSQVLLFYEGYGDTGLFCGGSILSENYVVTAAHCFYGYPDLTKYWLVAGMYRAYKHRGTEQYRNITEITYHPNYINETFQNDIMILKMDSPLNWTKFVQPSNLATEDFEPNENCWMTGHGWVNENREVYARVNQEYEVTITSNRRCQKAANRYGISDETIDSTVFCTKDKRKGGCNSDSGGPVGCFNETTGDYVQIGVRSWTLANQRCAKGWNVVMRVNQYLDFIYDVTGLTWPGTWTRWTYL